MPHAPQSAKKLREATFFLDHMRAIWPTAMLADESFDFFLSAFLAAARSVTLVLQAEQKVAYDAWFPGWGDALPSDEKGLLKFLKNERNDILKVGVTSRDATTEPMPALEFMTRSAAANLEQFSFDPQAMILVNHYYFDVDGARRPVIEVCSDGVRVLQRLLDAFGAE